VSVRSRVKRARARRLLVQIYHSSNPDAITVIVAANDIMSLSTLGSQLGHFFVFLCRRTGGPKSAKLTAANSSKDLGEVILESARYKTLGNIFGPIRVSPNCLHLSGRAYFNVESGARTEHAHSRC
jgi:hypothetical protein